MSVDPNQLLAQLGQGGPPAAAPGAMGGPDPTQQIIWQAFPSTDPTVAAQTPPQEFPNLMIQDTQKLEQLQQQAWAAAVQQSAPQQQSPTPQSAGPGVGGGLGG